MRNGSRVLEVHLEGDTARALSGSMVAFEGQVQFKHAGMGGGEGLRGALKRKMTGESLQLMEMTGHGVVYCAADGQEVQLIELQGETLQVESSSLLAVGSGLRTDVTFTGLRGATSGQGLFTTTVTGQGTVVVVSDGPAIVLEVSPQHPLVVDPQAYVCSRGQLQQSFVTDISWRNAVGEGNGEAFSLQFNGSGAVYIQPAER
ncbi:AIM24 family protein [Angustibacter aerolatus]